MKTMRRIAEGVVLLVLSVSPAWAGSDVPPWYEKVSVGGELRLRNENQLHYNPIVGGVDDDSFALLRVRPHVEAKPTEGVRLFVQPQFSRIFAQEESTIANNGDIGNANNVFDLHQGYLDLEKIGGSIVSLRLGRQELVYGDERLVGAFGWSNIGRNFDAGKVRLGWEKVWIDGFFAWNERTAGNEYFGGLYGSWTLRPDMTLDLYSLLLRDNDGDGVVGVTALTLETFGSRWAGTFLDKRIDYNVEGALQVGKTHPNNHFAWAGHLAGGYTFDTLWKPRLGLEYNIASGDDTSTATVERFNNLFPTNHDKYGYIDFASWRNLHDIVASAGVKPVTGLLVKLDYHLMLLPDSVDGMYRASGARLRAGVAGASHLAGHEVDFLTKYQWNKWVQFLGGYSFFKGGEFFSDTGTNGTAHFLYAQTQASF